MRNAKKSFSYICILLQNKFLVNSFVLINQTIIPPLICFTVNLIWLRNLWNKKLTCICEANSFVCQFVKHLLSAYRIPVPIIFWPQQSTIGDCLQSWEVTVLIDKKIFSLHWNETCLSLSSFIHLTNIWVASVRQALYRTKRMEINLISVSAPKELTLCGLIKKCWFYHESHKLGFPTLLVYLESPGVFLLVFFLV